MVNVVPGKTKPKELGIDTVADAPKLAAGRYGTAQQTQIWGPEATMGYSLHAQGVSALALNAVDEEIVPRAQADEIMEAANLRVVDPDRIREIEEQTGHDVIAISTALEEQVSESARSHVGKAKTSADTTQPARALQLKAALEEIIDSIEVLRDIAIEKSIEWIDVPHMDTSHLYDALPTVAGRPFAFYAEMIQTGLNNLRYFYDNSIIGKWADATGNHHQASALGIDGIALQKKYCDMLGVGHMDAPAQIPGLEFEADIIFGLARVAETMGNLGRYLAWGRSDDVNIFINASKKRQKGSSSMPHKDAKNGNPTTEEQLMSIANHMRGAVTTALSNCQMAYARDLSASANMRILLDNSFKFMDQGVCKAGKILYTMQLREERCRERVTRSYGVVTANRILTYITDPRKVDHPMSRSEGHHLLGELATRAWDERTLFSEILCSNEQITSRIDAKTIVELSDPEIYIGQSKEAIREVAQKHYQKKTLDK